MRTVFLIGLLCFTSSLFSQMSEDDEVTYQAAIDWLDSKLNYVYYDEVSGKWWKNTFYINDKKGVTIKHISSDKPNTANIRNKNYTIRTFNLTDINPYNISISEEEDSKGRIVKGKVLEIRTLDGKKSINKKINTRKGSSTSFLFFSFPEFLNDSLANYAEVVKAKLTEAIVSSTKVYATNQTENFENIFALLGGKFRNEAGEKWVGKQLFPNTLKIISNDDVQTFFGYDHSIKQFYLTSIKNEGVKTIYYELVDGNKLHLTEVDGTSNILIETLNSFKMDGISYFRE